MRRIAITGVAALTLLGGGTIAGAAVANSPIDGSGVIHGCYNPRSRHGSYTVRLQSMGTSCPRGTMAISWNQQGPQGMPGPQDGNGNTAYACTGARGATGPQGPAGAANVDYGVVQVTTSIQDRSPYTECSFDEVGGPDALTVFAAWNGSIGTWTCEITGFPAGAVPTVTYLSDTVQHQVVLFSPGQNLYVTVSPPAIVNGVGGTAGEFTFMIIDPSS
jgi:hypothetical protein